MFIVGFKVAEIICQNKHLIRRKQNKKKPKPNKQTKPKNNLNYYTIILFHSTTEIRIAMSLYQIDFLTVHQRPVKIHHAGGK